MGHQKAPKGRQRASKKLGAQTRHGPKKGPALEALGAEAAAMAVRALVDVLQRVERHMARQDAAVRDLTVRQVADLLGVGQKVVRKAIGNGLLVAARYGGCLRVQVDDLLDYRTRARCVSVAGAGNTSDGCQTEDRQDEADRRHGAKH